jgi:hypothetical protein
MVRGIRSNDGKTVEYNTGGFYPLSALDFRLPDADSIEVNIRYKFSSDEDWRFLSRKTLFRLNAGKNGELLQNEPMAEAAGITAPFWQLEASDDHSFSLIPDCYFTWAVHELIFLGRGKGPWTLAYGNEAYGPGDTLLRLEDFSALSPEIEKAVPAGEGRYQRRAGTAKAPEHDWGQFLLWTILILSVILLSSLAFYIAKSKE